MKVYCAVLLGLALVASIEAWGPGSIGCCPPGDAPACPVQPCDDFFNLFPHPNNCNFFIHCDAGRQPVCKQCPAGLHFNPKLHVCDWPENACCDASLCTPKPPCSTTPTPCTSTTTCTTTTPCTSTTTCTTTTPCTSTTTPCTTTKPCTTTTKPVECFGDEC